MDIQNERIHFYASHMKILREWGAFTEEEGL